VCYLQLLDGLDKALRESLEKYYNGTACHVSDTGMKWKEVQETVSRFFCIILYFKQLCRKEQHRCAFFSFNDV